MGETPLNSLITKVYLGGGKRSQMKYWEVHIHGSYALGWLFYLIFSYTPVLFFFFFLPRVSVFTSFVAVLAVEI